MMIILYVLLAIFLIFIYLMFAAAMQILFTFNSQSETFKVAFFWLYPFLEGVISLEDENLILTVMLFRKQIFRKELMQGGREKTKGHLSLKLAGQVKPWDIRINVAYGFKDPSATGIACGAINVAASLLDVRSLEQAPDFMPGSNYVNIDAEARINPGTTLVNLYKAYINHSRKY